MITEEIIEKAIELGWPGWSGKKRTTPEEELFEWLKKEKRVIFYTPRDITEVVYFGWLNIDTRATKYIGFRLGAPDPRKYIEEGLEWIKGGCKDMPRENRAWIQGIRYALAWAGVKIKEDE